MMRSRGFLPLVGPVFHFFLWTIRALGLHKPRTFEERASGEQELLLPPPVRSNLSPTQCSPDFCPHLPPAEQRRLREHLELVVLHPPHHHRLLFYAEPRSGCAVRVSLCHSPLPSSQDKAMEAFFHSPGRE